MCACACACLCACVDASRSTTIMLGTDWKFVVSLCLFGCYGYQYVAYLFSSDIHNTCVRRNTHTQPIPVISSPLLSVDVYNSVQVFFISLCHTFSPQQSLHLGALSIVVWPPYVQSCSHALSFMSTAPLDFQQRRRAWAIHIYIGRGSWTWSSNTLHCGKGLIFKLWLKCG